MLEVDNFLIIFPLEVGGKFFGWFGIITNTIVLPLSIAALTGVCIDKDLSFLRDKLEEMEIETLVQADDVAISRLRDYLIFTLILFVIMSGINLLASAMLLRGTLTRNFRQITPAKNILAFCAIFSVFGLLMRFSINAAINSMIYIYVFAVINSLWRKFKSEDLSGERLNQQGAQFYPIVLQPKV